MAEAGSVRVEIAFEGGQVMAVDVSVAAADELERALVGAGEEALTLDAADGRYTIVLRRVDYIKRHARESRVGFGI